MNASLGRIAPRDRGFTSREVRELNTKHTPVIARSPCDEAIHSFFSRRDGLLRGACHRARIRATRWLAMTVVNSSDQTEKPRSMTTYLRRPRAHLQRLAERQEQCTVDRIALR